MIETEATVAKNTPTDPKTPEGQFSWQTVRVTYIVPFLQDVEEVANNEGTWTESNLSADGSSSRTVGILSATVEARRAEEGGKPSPISGHFLGSPIRRALGRLDPGGTNTVIREKWTPLDQSEVSPPANVRAWTAERLHFAIGERTRKFIVISLDLELGTDVETFLVKEGRKVTDPCALAEILEVIQPQIKLRGDGGLLIDGAKSQDDLASRFLVSTVTMAVPSGPGVPPPIRFLDGYKNWGTAERRWSYFLATHRKHDRRLPPDSEAFAQAGSVNGAGAYNIRVEPFGTSVMFNDSIPEAWWDQLRILSSGANPFVDLAILNYWQHTCLEYFTDELAKQAHPATSGDHADLSASLEALRKFGDDYFFFRNCIWFDSVPNQPVWTEYLRQLQDSLGDREALARLAADYKDWTSHLGNRVALEDEKRRSLNETQLKVYSGLAAVAGIAFALLTILVEPASQVAWWLGLGLSALLTLGVVTVAGFFRRVKKCRNIADSRSTVS